MDEDDIDMPRGGKGGGDKGGGGGEAPGIAMVSSILSIVLYSC